MQENVIIQALKEDIIDAVNDLKGKPEIWNLSQELKHQCDNIIKKMVFCQSQQNIGHVYDLVRSLFDVLRKTLKDKQNEPAQAHARVDLNREQKERKLVKNLEISIDVFQRAAEKLGKTGEREWQEVLNQQCVILEQLIQVSVNSGPYKGQKSPFEEALKDFNLSLNKALEAVVSQDTSQSQNEFEA